MKYRKAKKKVDNEWEEVDLTRVTLEEAEKLSGKICCPGDKCEAKLYVVHSTKTGGRTAYFKATNSAHEKDCPYRIENYKSMSMNVSDTGYITEKQVHDFVRTLHRDVTMPLDEKKKRREEQREKVKKEPGKKREGGKQISYTGKMIRGEIDEDAVRGRMSRRYEVSTSDIGKQIGVYGYLKNVELDQHGQIRLCFREERYNNIEVLIGNVYKYSNPSTASYLHIIKTYFDKEVAKENAVHFVAAGLVTEYSGRLTIEVQAKNGFMLNGQTISRMTK